MLTWFVISCREQADLLITTFSGTTIASLQMSFKSSPTNCVTRMFVVLVPFQFLHQHTTHTWLPSEPGTIWWIKNMIGECHIRRWCFTISCFNMSPMHKNNEDPWVRAWTLWIFRIVQFHCSQPSQRFLFLLPCSFSSCFVSSFFKWLLPAVPASRLLTAVKLAAHLGDGFSA